MKIEIPDKLIKEFIINHVGIHSYDSIGDVLNCDSGQLAIKDLITRIIIEKYSDEIEWPKVSKKEIKALMLDKLAERALDNY